ncbi:MAG: hypothetical protein IT310_13455 [Anaerolineales bacterium]|nr:hypothetical protein [Anaerolineales bacterium]
MLKKIVKLAGTLLSMVITLIVMTALFASLLTSLEVQCELQADQSYTCESRDVFFGWTLAEVHATQVYDIERNLDCRGAGPKKGCSAHAEFLTTTGDRIVLSRTYTESDQVQKAVNALKPLMADKSTPIEMTFPPMTFTLVIAIGSVSCVAVIFLLVAVIMVFGKDPKDLEARALDLRQRR